MKKILKTIGILLTLFILGIGIYWFLRKDIRYQSVYLVPSDAAMILKMENPFETIDVLTSSDVWEFLKQNKDIAELNQQVLTIDSLVHDNKLLLRLLGSADLLMSYHPVDPAHYDMLFIATIKPSKSIPVFLKRINKILGDGYTISSRVYKESTVYELLDRLNAEYYYFTIVKNKLLFSMNHQLVEKSIDEQNRMTIGRDLHYIDVAKHVDQKGLLALYIPVQEFTHWLHPFVKNKSLVGQLNNMMHYAGANLLFIDGKNPAIRLKATLNDTSRSLYTQMIQCGQSQLTSLEIIPSRCATFVNIGMEDFQRFYQETRSLLSHEDQDQIAEYRELLNKKFDISIEKNLLSWIGDEITLMQTAPSNLGSYNEFAFVIKANNAEKARENLHYITNQIKKNSPAGFNSIDYRGYQIHYLSFGRLIKLLFGNLLEKLDKPYFTQINEYVIFSNHPQTLKNTIDDHLSQSTLAYNPEYYNFAGNFKNTSNIFIYLNTPVFYNNLQTIVSSQTWQNMQPQRKYITSFSQVGISMRSKRDMLDIEIVSNFVPQYEKQEPIYYQSIARPKPKPQPDTALFSQADAREKYDLSFLNEIVIHDLDANKQEVFYENDVLKYEFRLKDGLKHGMFKAYYENGNIQIKGRLNNGAPVNTWKFYDQDGNMIHEKEFD
ncbi:MAG: DUF3352 domain-containing protein [Bacteroidetes bacterium]|jgi:hypothetical protein|nr:DUF3352 domain-containing protein [Bacteroidota bacterium]